MASIICSRLKVRRLPNMVIGGYDKDMVSTALGAGASEAGRNAATAAIAELKAGKPIFNGQVNSNTGKAITARDTRLYGSVLEPAASLVGGILGTVWTCA